MFAALLFAGGITMIAYVKGRLELIMEGEIIVENNGTNRRLMLSLLLRQPFEEESLRSDFIDFCESKITACSQPYAIRAYCMKLAYEQMKYYPELLAELKATLDMLSQEHLSPALQSAKNQVMKKIKKSLGGK